MDAVDVKEKIVCPKCNKDVNLYPEKVVLPPDLDLCKKLDMLKTLKKVTKKEIFLSDNYNFIHMRTKKLDDLVRDIHEIEEKLEKNRKRDDFLDDCDIKYRLSCGCDFDDYTEGKKILVMCG